MAHESSLVSLSIPKEVASPIVSAKIQEAVLAALGGADKIVEAIIYQICNTQVSPKTGKKPDYSSDPTVSWMDYQVTQIIQKAVETQLKEQLDAGALPIKNALLKVLGSSKGSIKFAESIIQSLTDTFKGENIIPKVTIEFDKKKTSNW